MKAAIITIGDEILIGQIVDTNSAWMAQKMTSAGFEIVEKIAIGDDAQQIKKTIDDVFTRVDVILTTGGLGPTKDDITKKTLCEYFDTELVFDESVLENIHRIYSKYSATLNPLTHDQAYVPKNCIVIQNEVGTAPVTWFDRNNKVLVSMPGVPNEMKFVMENEIIPRLQDKYSTEAYVSQVLGVGGYTESALAIHLTEFENNLPKGFGLAYLPSLGLMKLRLFVKGEERRPELNNQVEKLHTLLGDAILTEKDIPLEKILGEHLLKHNLTIGTAESCTGGNIAHLITSISGSSAYFKGGIVSYANEVKCDVLNVTLANIEKDGAVSEAVVKEMVLGAQKVLNVDCAIAVSGVAGPDGGTTDKPVGTVWIATVLGNKVVTQKYQIGLSREMNITRASNVGMLQLLKQIAEN